MGHPGTLQSNSRSLRDDNQKHATNGKSKMQGLSAALLTMGL
jgi:hypothetical protein